MFAGQRSCPNLNLCGIYCIFSFAYVHKFTAQAANPDTDPQRLGLLSCGDKECNCGELDDQSPQNLSERHVEHLYPVAIGAGIHIQARGPYWLLTLRALNSSRSL